MDFYETVKKRRSVRKYTSQPIAGETLERILEAGRLAPSWCNRQCWRYIAVSDAELRRSLGQLLENPSAECYEDAPIALILCADPSDSGRQAGKEYYLVDCGISMEHVVLAATAEGLSTCWVGYFAENPIKKLLNIPEDTRVVAVTPLGYGAEEPEATPRKQMAEIVFENSWKY